MTIKPLVWVMAIGGDKLCHDHWCATALGGAYHMAPDEDSAGGSWLLQWTIRSSDFCMSYGGTISNHPSPEAAKAAAQADYEAHLTALLRAEYERGVREAAAVSKGRGFSDGSSPPDHPYDRGYQRGVDECTKHILALLTQEGR